VVDANLLALRAIDASGHTCNIGCGERITLNELIRLLEEIVGIKATVNYTPSKTGDVRHSLAEITMARRFLGYEPKVMVKEGLRETVEAFRIAERRREIHSRY
jgi:nucleoside-diphosphate-sugar epimerase